jgi:hypothetical protein
MFINSSSPMGMNFCILNIFKIPVVNIPIPLPNIAKGMMATGFSTKVLLGFMPAHTRDTSIPLTLGDTPGFAMGGGIASGMAMGESKHILSSFTVLAENKPVTRLMDMTTQNKNNGVGLTMAPSQFKVMSLS